MIVFAVIMCILGFIGSQGVVNHQGLAAILYIVGSMIAGVSFGVTGVIIWGIVSIIVGIIFFIAAKSSGSIYSSSSGPSMVNWAKWAESKMNDPHTCGNCTEYSSTKGECRRSGNSMSAEDSCINWK